MIITLKAGNIKGLAKHLSKKFGGDPHFFTKCAADEELAGYDETARKSICAEAHKAATGIYPGAHSGANPNANEPVKKCCNKRRFVLRRA